jgi:hypothetical protein
MVISKEKLKKIKENLQWHFVQHESLTMTPRIESGVVLNPSTSFSKSSVL